MEISLLTGKLLDDRVALGGRDQTAIGRDLGENEAGRGGGQENPDEKRERRAAGGSFGHEHSPIMESIGNGPDAGYGVLSTSARPERAS